MQHFTERIAFITGGASGIGFGMAEAFASRGMSVAIADIDEAAIEARAQELRALGAKVLPLVLDVRDRDNWEQAARETESKLGPVDILCNNAGVTGYTPLAQTPPEQWDWIISVNLTGTFNGVHTFAQRMIDRKAGGHIVNTASTAGLYASKNFTIGAYTASKCGVIGMSEMLRTELAPHGIGVSILCPGLVKTNIGPNTIKLRPGPKTEAPALTPLQERLRADSRRYGMDPRKVGDRVAVAIQNNDCYIITHPEFRRFVEARFQALLADFKESADPDLTLDPDWIAKAT